MKLFGLIKGKDAALVGVGAVAGVLGSKVVSSAAAHRVAVKGVAAGLRAKSSVEDMLEQVKIQADDIVAEATYLNEQTAAQATADTASATGATNAATPTTGACPAAAPAPAAE